METVRNEPEAEEEKPSELELAVDIGVEPTESVASTIPPVEQPHKSKVDNTNILSPVKATGKMIWDQVRPKEFKEMTPISYQKKDATELYGEELRELAQLELKAIELDESLNGPSERRNIRVWPAVVPSKEDKARYDENAMRLHQHMLRMY